MVDYGGGHRPARGGVVMTVRVKIIGAVACTLIAASLLFPHWSSGLPISDSAYVLVRERLWAHSIFTPPSSLDEYLRPTKDWRIDWLATTFQCLALAMLGIAGSLIPPLNRRKSSTEENTLQSNSPKTPFEVRQERWRREAAEEAEKDAKLGRYVPKDREKRE
jgi:hypothetical protein